MRLHIFNHTDQMQLRDMQIHQTLDVISVIVMHTCR
jgi:hypothetical protein